MKKPSSKEEKGLRRNLDRADPATLSHYLCYYCGKMSSDRVEYQQHMLKVHEVLSQSYQLWSDQMMDTLGLRWSETRRQSEELSIAASLPASPKSEVSQYKKNSDDDDEDYVYEENERPARKRKDDSARRRAKPPGEKRVRSESSRKADAEAKRKKRLEGKKIQDRAQNEAEKRRIEEARIALDIKMEAERERLAAIPDPPVAPVEPVPQQVTTQPVEIKQEEVAPQVEGRSAEKKKRRRSEGSRRTHEETESDKSDVSALVKKIFEESKKKEASSQEVEDEADVLTDEDRSRKPMDATVHTQKYCKVCKKGTHYLFPTLFEHYIDHHHAVLQSFNYYGFSGKELIGKKHLLERDYCQRCLVTFPTAKEYFVHMIKNHIYESVRCQLGFENATNADVEARLLFRDRIITCGYNFRLEPNVSINHPRIPKTEESEAPGPSDQPEAPVAQQPTTSSESLNDTVELSSASSDPAIASQNALF